MPTRLTFRSLTSLLLLASSFRKKLTEKGIVLRTSIRKQPLLCVIHCREEIRAIRGRLRVIRLLRATGAVGSVTGRKTAKRRKMHISLLSKELTSPTNAEKKNKMARVTRAHLLIMALA